MTEYVERLEFRVDGTPIPQGSKSIFRGRLVESNPKLKAWRAMVTATAAHELGGRDGFPKEADLYVLLDFYMPRGRTVRRPRPNVKPDLDKCIRAVFDSLTRTVWVDDGQVVSVHAQQWYADDRPGVRVVVGELA